MKKNTILFFLILVSITSFVIYSCTKVNESSEVQTQKEKIIAKFINSSTFQRTKGIILNHGELSKQDVTLDSVVINNSQTFHFFTIVLKKNGILTGTLDVIDLHETKNLPYGDTYALNFNDMSELNINNFTGTIKLFDINYDNHQHTEIKLNANKIVTRVYNVLPKELRKKFASIRLKPKSNTLLSHNNITHGAKAVPCDYNHNGNLSFLECYGCLKSATDVQGTFGQWWCDAPVAGWASCFTTISAACVVLSSMY